MKHTSHVQCHYPGCRETSFYEYHSRKEQSEASRNREKWLCVRHTNPDSVLSQTNTVRKFEVVSQSNEKLNGMKFWGSQGLITGPGFKAYANDFPAGTKLVVTVEIQLPIESKL